MSKKSRDNNYSFDFDEINNDSAENSYDEENKKILFDFGNSIENQKSDLHIKSEKGLSPLESLKKKIIIKDDYSKNTPETSEKENGSLLKKLKRYTTDESGHDVTEDTPPLYTLKSVAEIIKSDSDELLNKLSKKYDVQFDDLSHSSDDNTSSPKNEDNSSEDITQNSDNAPTEAFKKMSEESKTRFEKNLFEELFPNENPEPEETTETSPNISDIDNSDSESTVQNATDNISNTATIRFTPVADRHGNTGRINVSTSTKSIDIRQELTKENESEGIVSNLPLELDDFDMYVQKDEITDINSAKSTLRKLAYKRRKNFISLLVCAFSFFISLLFLLPFLSDVTISSPRTVDVICSLLLLFGIVANSDMFSDIPALFKKNAGHDCILSLSAVLSVFLCLFAISKGENIYHIILLSSMVFLARAISKYMQTATMFSNLKLAASKGKKYGIEFIKDEATALAMAKNSIDGDVCITAPAKTEFISDFFKYSYFKKKFSGKMPLIFIISLVLSALGVVISYFYYKSIFASLYTATVTLLIAAMPVVCFVDVLPLFCAAKKLNKSGAFILGAFGADKLETANATVVSTADIFPAGTITLENFKVLSENNIDRTLKNAAALTEEAGSTLAPILEKIASTDKTYQKPDSDTIKYEERLGLSGWVDNDLLFVGNRSLMLAHGIEVPDMSVDKKILAQGMFPVYIATGGKACAILLIRYNVRKDIGKLLSRISKLGITLLVNNCDPNINEDMICDNFGLYDDSVKVMTAVGTHMYKNAVPDTDIISSPAGFKANKLSILKIMSAASRIRSSNTVLSVFYVLASIFGIWYYVYSSFAQSGGLLSGSAILTFEILATLFATVSFLIRKP